MPYSSDNVADIRNLQQYCSKIFGATEALPLLHTLNCSGQVGRTGKANSVTTWCARHQQQHQSGRLVGWLE